MAFHVIVIVDHYVGPTFCASSPLISGNNFIFSCNWISLINRSKPKKFGSKLSTELKILRLSCEFHENGNDCLNFKYNKKFLKNVYLKRTIIYVY